jgi:recombinational DNA repair protein RecT
MSDKTTALAQRPDDAMAPLAQYLRARTKQLANYALGKLKPETMIQLALFHASKDSYLRACTPESIYSALVLSAQLGLEPSGARGEAYLIAYNKRCTLDRGHVIATYAVAYLQGSKYPDIEVCGPADIKATIDFVKKSRGNKLPDTYENWEGEMLRKAPLRRLCKRLPAGDDYVKALMADELAEAGQSATDVREVLDAEYTEVVDEAAGGGLRDRVRQVAQQGGETP